LGRPDAGQQFVAPNVHGPRGVDAEPNLAVLDGHDRHRDRVANLDLLPELSGELQHACLLIMGVG
jgi:hypothetical protein